MFSRKDIYVSRYTGNDSTKCGSENAPCRTLAHGVEIAGWNGRIFLDGTFNEWDPYICERNGNNSVNKEENRITVNVSLDFVAFRSPARINCGDLLKFTASPSNRNKMEITFTGIVFYNTSITVIDSSVFFVNCSFVQSIYPIDIWLFHRKNATVVVKNSSFFNNTGCIRLQQSKATATATVSLTSVAFQRNQLLHQQGHGVLVRINISCNSSTFSNNTGPLITNTIEFSETNEYYHHVTFSKNSARSLNSFSSNSVYFSKAKFSTIVFDDFICTDNVNTRCIHIESSEVSLRILNSNISGHDVSTQHGAGIFVLADKSIYSYISGTTLQRNKGKDGGAVALRSSNANINLTFHKCYLLNNSACNGGALSVTTQNGLAIIDVKNSTVRHCRAVENGGAFYIKTDRESVFVANNSIWAYNKANKGSAILLSSVSSAGRGLKKTNMSVEAKLWNCRFMNNIDLVSPWASVLIIASVGRVEVLQTEWIKNVNCFYVECNCIVNFTKVNISSSFITAVQILSGKEKAGRNSAMKIHFERCIFDSNKGNHMIVNSKGPYLYLLLNNVQVNGTKMLKRGTKSVLDVLVANETMGSTIRLQNVLIENAIGSASVILRIRRNSSNKLKVEIVDSVFRKIRSVYSDKFHTIASPLSIDMPGINPEIDCSSSYLRFLHNNTVIIVNTTFENNIGRASGGVFVTSGNVTMRNCYFENNYAINSGGHIHVAEGGAMLKIENSTLRQASPETIYNEETFTHDTSIYSESMSSLCLQKTLVVADLEKDTYRLFSVAKAGLVTFDNFSQVQCAVGSFLRIDNFSHFMTLWPRKTACKFKTTVMTISCHRCLAGFYSLERGELRGLSSKKQKQTVSTNFCIPCPYGANCSRNIVAKPNFWGYPESNHPPSLTFVHCPPHYCKPTHKRVKNLSVYNSCRGNRDGVMCGRCKAEYTETLFSKNCTQSEKCTDHWMWPLMIIYAVAMALFFIYKPPIIQLLVENTLWFKTSTRNRAEYQSLDQPNQHNKGYTKIIFYFYQISSYLAVEPVSDVIKKAAEVIKRAVPFVSFFSGLFNFSPRISTGGFGCPFSGLNVITKELLLASGVFATLISVQSILILHWTFNKLTGRPRPSTAPYVAATLETLLLGYATLANTSLKLLTCVPVLGECRLYYDANIKCLQWWQYFFIVYVVAFLLPFIAVIYWGAMKLQRKLISVGHFIGACFFPLGFISLWLIQKLHRGQNRHQQPGTNDGRQEILKMLHDPFCPPSRRQIGSLYWESVLIGRRFLLLSYQVFFPDPLLRLFFMDMTCLLVFTWHLATKPFHDRKANVIEAVSLAVLVVIATINLIQAIFLSAGVTPQGPVIRNLIILEQVEICLLGIMPLLFGLLCVFAIVSQLVRIFVLLLRLLYYAWRRIFTLIVMHRLRNQGQY